jgi:hypothetical protein
MIGGRGVGVAPTQFAAGLFLVLAAAGCQSRLNEQRTLKLDSGLDSFITLDPPRYDQTVAVTVSADVPVDVYVFLEADREEAERQAAFGKKSPKFLADGEKMQQGTLEAKVPAKQKALIMVRSNKSGTATLKIVGK